MDQQEKSLQIYEWERFGYSHLFSMKWGKKNLKYPQSESDMVFFFMEICTFPDIGDCMSFHQL